MSLDNIMSLEKVKNKVTGKKSQVPSKKEIEGNLEGINQEEVKGMDKTQLAYMMENFFFQAYQAGKKEEQMKGEEGSKVYDMLMADLLVTGVGTAILLWQFVL